MSLTSSQPEIATIPFLASTPTAILSPNFSTASFTSSGFLTAAVPIITLEAPAFILSSTSCIVLTPPPV